MSLAKADFFFGALLSRLVKTGFAPAIIEGGTNRRIYSLFNDHGEYNIYAKYISKPNTSNSSRSRWNFTFTADEVQEIKSFNKDNEDKYLFGLVCALEKMKGSEIVLLTYKELRQCIGVDYQTRNRRVSVELESGSWSFIVYGTGLERKVNSMRITRNVKKRLEELGFTEK